MLFRSIQEDYEELEGTATTAENWEDLLDRIDDLEEQVVDARNYEGSTPIRESVIEDKIIALQDRLNEAVKLDKLNRKELGRLQTRLDDIRRNYYNTDTDLQTAVWRDDIYRRLENLESDITVAMGDTYGPISDETYEIMPSKKTELQEGIAQVQIKIDNPDIPLQKKDEFRTRLNLIRNDLNYMERNGLTIEEIRGLENRLNEIEEEIRIYK